MTRTINSMNQTINIQTTDQSIVVSGMNNRINISRLKHSLKVYGMNNRVLINLNEGSINITGCNNTIQMNQYVSGGVSDTGMGNTVSCSENTTATTTGSRPRQQTRHRAQQAPQRPRQSHGARRTQNQQNPNGRTRNRRRNSNIQYEFRDSSSEEEESSSSDSDSSEDEDDFNEPMFMVNGRNQASRGNTNQQRNQQGLFQVSGNVPNTPNVNFSLNGVNQIGDMMNNIFGSHGVFTQQMRNLNQAQQSNQQGANQYNYSFQVSGNPGDNRADEPEPEQTFVPQRFNDDKKLDVPEGCDPSKVIPCCICMEKVSKESPNAAYLECAHFFHNRCIQNWFQLKQECPNCRHKCDGIHRLNDA